MWRRILWIGTLGSIAGMLAVRLNPVNSMALKLALLGFLAAAWTGCMVLAWRNAPLRWLLLLLPMLGAIPLMLPGWGKWIQADPGIGAVATLDGRTADNRWFRTPVTIHRWRLLEGHQPVCAGENSGKP